MLVASFWFCSLICEYNKNWPLVFPHQVTLTETFRQTDSQYITLLGDVAKGNLSKESEELIETLSRPLLHCSESDVVEYFCLSEQVMLSGLKYLDELDGEMSVYTSKDTGPESLLNRETAAERKLALKKGAKVMCTYNINDRIKNGTIGTVMDLKCDSVMVKFFDTGVPVEIKYVTWQVVDPANHMKIAATRTQLPLKLAKSMTVHKGQGQTVSKAVVYSGNEFCPGQLYVALSRVRSANDVQILGFDKSNLIQPKKEVVDFLGYLQRTHEANLVCPDLHECTCKVDIDCIASSPAKIARIDRESQPSTFGLDGIDEFDGSFMEAFEKEVMDNIESDFAVFNDNSSFDELDLDMLLDNLAFVDETLSSPPEEMNLKVKQFPILTLYKYLQDIQH